MNTISTQQFTGPASRYGLFVVTLTAFMSLLFFALLPGELNADRDQPESSYVSPILENAKPELVDGPRRYTEGPAAGPDGRIYFTEAGPVHDILVYDPATDQTEIFLDDSGGANGLFIVGDLLYICEDRQTRQVTVMRLGQPETRVVLASNFEGNRFNGPNDIAVVGGSVYFTDPKYGNKDYEMAEEAVYHIDMLARLKSGQEAEEAQPQRMISDLVKPNGIIASPDGKTLFVGDNRGKKIFAYDIIAPGQLANKRLHADIASTTDNRQAPDGMAIDDQGYLYVAGWTRVLIFDPTGQLIDTIEIGDRTSNCTILNLPATPQQAAERWLYFTSQNSLYRIQLKP